jgi:hypothetical protein
VYHSKIYSNMKHCHFFSCIRYDRRSTLDIYTNGMGIDEEVIQTSVSKTRRVSPYHLQILQFFQFSAKSRIVKIAFPIKPPTRHQRRSAASSASRSRSSRDTRRVTDISCSLCRVNIAARSLEILVAKAVASWWLEAVTVLIW